MAANDNKHVLMKPKFMSQSERGFTATTHIGQVERSVGIRKVKLVLTLLGAGTNPICCGWVHREIDGVKTKMSPTISFSDMYQNHLFIVGIGSIINKKIEFIYQSDCSDCTYVYS